MNITRSLAATSFLLFLTAGTLVSRAATVSIADFEDGVSDFNGTIVHDSTVAKSGSASGKIEADFTKPGDPWVTAAHSIEIKNDLKAASFWVKSSDFTGLTVRFVDSTGQNHQQRPTFPADGEWHEISIPTFDAGPGYEKFGGANDGKFHFPATSMAIIAEKGTLGGKDHGTLWIDDVNLDIVGDLPKEEPATKIVLADFEKDAGGFDGAIQRETGDAKNGNGYGKAEADFSRPGDPWVTSTRQIDVKNEFKSVSFWVKSSDASGLTFRLIDSTGQVHQQRPTFVADGQWHQVNLRAFDHGIGYEKWGGANDGKFHWPATQLALILEKSNLNGKTQGTWCFDDIELSVAGPARGALDEFKSVSLAGFETDTDGFSGAISRDGSGGKTGIGAGKIDADFSKPGDPWVTATKNLDLKNEIKAVRFWAKSSDASSITVRMVDSTGQTHQQRPPFAADEEWHQVTLGKLVGGPGYERWGGAADGQFHAPAASISFILEKPALAGKTAGSVLIDDVEALVDPNPNIPKAEIDQKRLGNVFNTTETVEIGLLTQADKVTWTVQDFWKRQIATGTTAVVDHYADIQPGKDLKGWYLLKIAAEKDGQPLATVSTTFCVITPIDIEAVRGSPFGVMTHFAQDWNTDIMPLIVKAGISTIRDELYWAQVETKPNEYVFRPQFEKYMAEAKKLKIDPLIIMSFANPLYDQGKTPYTSEGCEAYARYGEAIIKHFGDQIKWLEVWNEYNGSWCTGPAAQDRPRYYAQMLQHVTERIKGSHPDIKILGGAAVLQPIPYFQGIFQHGGLANMDAAVIHPYRGNPEGVDQDVNDLQTLSRKYDSKGKPIWATETGLIDPSPDGRDRIARYLVRQYTLLLSSGVEKIYWYLLRDYDMFTSMGLLRDHNDPLGKYVPAPAYVAYANLIRQLNGAKFVQRESAGEHTYVETFQQGAQPVRVCWATAPAHVAFRADGPLTLVDMMGGECTLTPVGGEVFLTLTDTPVYLKGDAKLIDTGRFTIGAEQVIDMTDQFRVHFSYDNHDAAADVAGTLAVDGESFPFKAKAGEKFDGDVVVSAEATSEATSRTCWYELNLNGSLAGAGGFVAHVVDPLVFVREPSARGQDRVQVTLRNRSSRVAYSIQGVDWSTGGQQRQESLKFSLPVGQQVTFDVPVQSMTAYQEYSLAMKVRLAGRTPATLEAAASYDPIDTRKVTLDGDLGEWKDAKSVTQDGQVYIAYDDAALYVAARSASPELTIGIAAADARRDLRDPRSGWYELRVKGNSVDAVLAPGATAAAPVAGATVKSHDDGGMTVYEVSIPWSSIAPIRPADGEVRLAIAAEDKAIFGDGIAQGKTPALYRICTFSTAAPAKSVDAGELTATVSSFDPAVTTPMTVGKVIADSYQDYSNTQGRQGWSYGYYGGDGKGTGNGAMPSGPYTDDDFHPMKFTETMWGYEWAEPTIEFMKLTPSGGHPGAVDGEPVWAVRRWTSPVDADVRVTGKINCFSNQGDGVDGKVIVDGVVAWTGASQGKGRPASSECDVVVHVTKGSFLDFAITPGPAADRNYDASDFSVRIEQLNAP